MASSKGPEMRFEVNFGKDVWKILPLPCQDKIKKALSASDTSVAIEYCGQKDTLTFDKMSFSHPNGEMNFVRCAVADSSGCFYVWSYKDDNNVWKSYHPHEIGILEQAFGEGEHLKKMDIAGKNYTIHFRRWHQESAETGYRRKISRIKSNAVDLDDVKPEPEDSKSSAGSVKSAASSVTKSMMTTVKGRPPVDPIAQNFLPSNLRCHIYVDDSTGDIYDVLLNQTNVAQNNNKYYIIQLIEADGAKQYWNWTRWGRVGYNGQNNLDACGTDLNEACRLFETKFFQKTTNNWSDRKKFVKRNGKYDLIERDFGANQEESEEVVENTENEQEQVGVKRKGSVGSRDKSSKKVKTEIESKVNSKLDIRLQHLLEMICDIHDMEEVVVSMNYDVQKAPLGKLTTTQLKAGYTALKKIAEIIESKDSEQERKVSSTRKAPSAGHLSSSARQALLEACNEFYTRVPHCFGMRQPPLIQTHAELKSKLELLETLGDIEIAIHSMKEEKALTSPEHPLDKHYRNLHCQMQPVEPGSNEFKMIDRYLHENHGMTHNNYKMELVEVFAVDRQDETAAFRSEVGNNMLLWHGSRLTNYYGILSQGLRIAPPEAPVTGYMFGKGVYFADSSSKSANYCQTSALRDVGFLLLCKVALGKPKELMAADYQADKLPKGFDSVKGLGKWIPNSSNFVTLDDGTLVPVGRMVANSDPNSPGFTLLYNEFVVYETRQIAMKYICKVKFNFNF